MSIEEMRVATQKCLKSNTGSQAVGKSKLDMQIGCVEKERCMLVPSCFSEPNSGVRRMYEGTILNIPALSGAKLITSEAPGM